MTQLDQIDSATLLHAVLASDSTLAAAVTHVVADETVVDIYGPPGLPANFTIRSGLFFLGLGGPGNPELPIGQEVFDCYCYGKDAAEARLIYRLLRRCLHRRSHEQLTIDSVVHLFQYAQLLSGPQDRLEPEEGWNLVYCSFMVQFAEAPLP